ncbi:MAG: acetolactate synthase small subunit [Clostridia bacterium]|nr:acetolactate synthase small subunit [Clostridia bacterium]
MNMEEVKKQILAVLVDNEAGVLSQISRLFSRKGYNIESLAVGTADLPNTSRITIEIMADDDHARLLSNQLRKLFPVHSVKLLTPQKSIRRELVLYKVRTPDNDTRNAIIQIANIFRANIIDVSVGTLTLAVVGGESKTEGIEKILEEFEVMELVRTGSVALERGQETIYDETKEKGEFNYGKNVL